MPYDDTATTDSLPLGHLMGQHYREIEETCLAVLGAGLADDPRDLVQCWSAVEHQLVDHMMAEERFLLPSYQRTDPETAQALRDQHARLRDRASEIGIAIQLHTIRCEQLEDFVAELRAHARDEEASLYRWADRQLAQEQHSGLGG